MPKRTLMLCLTIGFFAAAQAIVAQNADPNTAGPTKNDLRLRVTEPAQGATLTGSSVRVAVDYNRPIFGSGQGTKFGETTFPPAKFDVFVDNKLQQTLTAGESNVATIDGVAPGAHKLAVVAKNLSGEVIDRKEIDFQTTAEAATGNPAPAPVAAPPPPAPAPAPSAQETAPAPSAPATPATLPQTGSQAPRQAAAGLALVLAGFLVSRKAR